MTFVVLVFFFFKQKTAYEMRISDWSSDVCSSDLPVAGVRRASGHRAARSLLGIWQGRRPQEDSATRDGARSRAALRRPRGRLEAARRVRRHRPRAFQPGNRSDRIDRRRGEPTRGPRSSARQAQGVRSEEHTSELQSLMRISYAVFFLKKKKSIDISLAEQEQIRINSTAFV